VHELTIKTLDSSGKSFTKKTSYLSRSKNNLKKQIAYDLPFGSWFFQDLFKTGEVVMRVKGDDHYINEPVEDYDLKITYTLKKIEKDEQ
jgi:hypothetical protein